MNLRTFIERPVLSAVISITIVVVVGIIGLFSLPVEQLRYSSAYHYGEYHLLWCKCGNVTEECYCTFGRSHQWVEDMTYMTLTNSGTVSALPFDLRGQTRYGGCQRAEPYREPQDSFRRK